MVLSYNSVNTTSVAYLSGGHFAHPDGDLELETDLEEVAGGGGVFIDHKGGIVY